MPSPYPSRKDRQTDVDDFYLEHGMFDKVAWFKTTMASSDPLASAVFAAKYLGGVRMPSPYPKIEGELHYAEWVLLTPTNSERAFWLHFVRSAVVETPSVYEVADMLAQGRN